MMQTGSLGEGILKASENIVETYSYSPYGSVTISDQNGAVLDASDYGNEFFFQGRQFDKESGLYYFRNRYYSPDLGRFISRDPIGYAAGDINLYRFVGNNPYGGLDPMGLEVMKCGALADDPRLSWFGAQHHWLKTCDKSGGMGVDPSNPDRLVITDHSKRESEWCISIPDVNEECVNQYLTPGIPLEAWAPLQTCQDVAQMILDFCKEDKDKDDLPKEEEKCKDK
jgi:RHS repeat-associated protein